MGDLFRYFMIIVYPVSRNNGRGPLFFMYVNVFHLSVFSVYQDIIADMQTPDKQKKQQEKTIEKICFLYLFLVLKVIGMKNMVCYALFLPKFWAKVIFGPDYVYRHISWTV